MDGRPMVNVYEGTPPILVYREMNDEEYAAWQAEQAAYASAQAAPPDPIVLAAVPAAMAAANLATTFTSTEQVAAMAAQLHATAKEGIANFRADIAAWDTLTDAQKLSHILGLMQAMVGVLQTLTGDFS